MFENKEREEYIPKISSTKVLIGATAEDGRLL